MSRILTVTAILATIMIAALSLNALFWADEYFILEGLQRMSVWEFMLMQYRHWDGRFLSLNAVVQLNMVLWENPALAVGVWTGMFWLTAWLIRHVWVLQSGSKKGAAFISVSILFCLLWLGFSPVIAEILYWVTGGIYSMGLAMIMLFVWGWYYKPAKVSLLWLGGGLVLGMLLGLMGVTASFPILVFLLIEVLVQKGKKTLRAVTFRYAQVWSLGLIAGSMVNILAPGNYLRAGLLETSFVWNAETMFVDFLKIGWRYMKVSVWILPAGLLAMILLPDGGVMSLGRMIIFSSFRHLKWDMATAVYLLSRHQWLVVAFASALPMVVIPDIAGGRTAVYFMLFVFLWVLHWQTLRQSTSSGGIRIWISAGWQRGITLLLFLGIIVLSMHHFLVGRQIVQQVQEREIILSEMRGKTDSVRVAPIRVDHMPFSIFFLDLLDKHYARYHGFNSIELDTVFSEPLPNYYLNPRWSAEPAEP